MLYNFYICIINYAHLEFNLNKIKVNNSDILTFDENKLCKEKIVIFGNLPYNISTQILVFYYIQFF